MFAARANQENAIYEQQTAAAAKPLNQGVKGLAPKTPGNKAPKTPFKVPPNDENAAFGAGKTGGKGKDGLFGQGKSGKLDKSAFVTPAGLRNRAPLGNKTTNAKATAFQTPAPPTQDKGSAKHTSPRLRRAKIKVHEAEPATIEEDAEEREIEYMPPREVPLPDYPDDWPHDRTYPQFEGKNLTRGWWSEFVRQKDDNGDDEFSDFEEKLKQIEERDRKQQLAQQVKTPAVPKTSSLQKITRNPLAAKAPSTLKSKSAASALSKPSTLTAANKARHPTASIAAKKPATNVQMPAGNSRHTAARVASNSTLGYSKGRAFSATSRKPLSGIYERQLAAINDQATSPDKKASAAGSSLEDLFGIHRLELDGEEDEDLRDFQLDAIV